MPLQARQIKTPRLLFLALFFFFVFPENLWPKFFPLFILQYIFIITIIFILLYLHLIMCILYYTLHYIMCTYSHMENFLRICVCVPPCDLTSRVAGRRQLSNFQWYYIFFPAAEHKSKLWNYRISVGLPKKGVPETSMYVGNCFAE